VFLSGAFQDEQTGPQFTSMLDEFTQTSSLKVGLWNGRHPDGLGPVNLVRWYEFLKFDLAQRVPHMNPLVRAFAPAIVAGVFGFEDVEFESDRWYEQFGDDYTAARAAYDVEDPIRVVYTRAVAAPTRSASRVEPSSRPSPPGLRQSHSPPPGTWVRADRSTPRLRSVGAEGSTPSGSIPTPVSAGCTPTRIIRCWRRCGPPTGPSSTRATCCPT
jgi:hypothetical protein